MDYKNKQISPALERFLGRVFVVLVIFWVFVVLVWYLLLSRSPDSEPLPANYHPQNVSVVL